MNETRGSGVYVDGIEFPLDYPPAPAVLAAFPPVVASFTQEPDIQAARAEAEVAEPHAGCCDHTSTSDRTRRRFKAALKKLGIPLGNVHDSCFGLMNHLDTGEEYRWQDGQVQQFDREAYQWNTLEVK